MRSGLEGKVHTINRSIAKHEADYNAHVEVLTTISESLMSLLRNVSVAVTIASLHEPLFTASVSRAPPPSLPPSLPSPFAPR